MKKDVLLFYFNIVENMKTMTRKELAYRAGVCTRTLRNWTDDHYEELYEMGMRRGCALPPIVCEWIVENYGINMDKKGKK
jgi:DNA-binding XRE family transcriptional regulator